MIEDLVNQGKICKKKKKTQVLKLQHLFNDDVMVLAWLNFSQSRGQNFDSSYITLKATLAQTKKDEKVGQHFFFKSANK